MGPAEEPQGQVSGRVSFLTQEQELDSGCAGVSEGGVEKLRLGEQRNCRVLSCSSWSRLLLPCSYTNHHHSSLDTRTWFRGTDIKDPYLAWGGVVIKF